MADPIEAAQAAYSDAFEAAVDLGKHPHEAHRISLSAAIVAFLRALAAMRDIAVTLASVIERHYDQREAAIRADERARGSVTLTPDEVAIAHGCACDTLSEFSCSSNDLPEVRALQDKLWAVLQARGDADG